jgi:UDP-N-acetylglucosamine--N-acetylmuramyl-(pentapeptide) pyrophosphoryl-undecaprenol N-acetylglucosamine transferase
MPATVAARILRIPLLIHESDSAPGRANLWAGKFAARIALSWPEAAQFFSKEKTAVTGQPVRKEIVMPAKHGAREYLGITEDIPVIYICGGSQGAQIFNDAIVDILPQLIQKYQIIHQTGRRNFAAVSSRAKIVLENNPNAARYRPFDYLNDIALKMVAGVTTLVISRAGSTIFEIAAWGLPSIIIPIALSHNDHQKENAFNYARTGSALVIEEENMTSHVLLYEIERIFSRPEELKKMGESARAFFKPDAARQIAEEILRIALSHE